MRRVVAIAKAIREHGCRRAGRLAAAALLGWALGALSVPAQAKAQPTVWPGVVTRVVDGDTVHVRPLDGGTPRPIRIVGIDAPEICQPGGAAARLALSRRLLKREVRVSTQAQDDYGRDLATLALGPEDVGEWLVQRGHAWSYRFRRNPGPYVQAEQHARVLGRGLFAEPDPEYPGAFRRRHGPCPPSAPRR